MPRAKRASDIAWNEKRRRLRAEARAAREAAKAAGQATQVKPTSDVVYNERKKLQRAAARAQKRGDVELAGQLTRTAQQMYYDRNIKSYSPGIEQTIREGRILALREREASGTREARSNVAFLAELNKAAKGQPNALVRGVEDLTPKQQAQASKLMASVFMLSTRDAWERAGGKDKVRSAAAVLGYTSYQKLWEDVFSQNAEALAKLVEIVQGGEPEDLGSDRDWWRAIYEQVASYINVFR